MSDLPSLLSSFALFGGCSPEDLAALSGRLRRRPIPAGGTVMREGEAAAEFALLLTGSAAITRASVGGDELLGVAGPGAIVGELALLRATTRTATVTADVACEVAVGDLADLHFLIDLPGVHDQVRDLASARLAQDVSPVKAVVRDGLGVLLRPLLPADRPGFSAAVGALSAETLRHRFFIGGQPSSRMIDYLIDVDFVDHFAWLTLLEDDPTVGVATGRYVRSKRDPAEAEIAFAVVDAYQAHGIGRLLVGAVGVAACNAGVERLVASVQVDNTPMRALLDRIGTTFVLDEPGVVRGEVSAEAAAQLLDAELRAALDRSSRDIVTAAGLALA